MSDNVTNQFVDTNVLVYAHDNSAGLKHEQTQNLLRSLWESGLGCLSIQVFQEFYVTVTRKVANPLAPEQASQIISNLSTWQVHSPTVDDIPIPSPIMRR
jgi:predicted nucleic acid-binding protein